MKVLDIGQLEIIGEYIELFYNDKDALSKLKFFLQGYEKGWKEAINTAANYIYRWHSNMDSLHEGTIKGIITEIESGVLALEPGDV